MLEFISTKPFKFDELGQEDKQIAHEMLAL